MISGEKKSKKITNSKIELIIDIRDKYKLSGLGRIRMHSTKIHIDISKN